MIYRTTMTLVPPIKTRREFRISFRFVNWRALFLLASALSFAMAGPAHAMKPIKWDFYMSAGQGGDVPFDTDRTVCFPDGVRFTTRVSPQGEASYADDIMQSDEHLVSVDGPTNPSSTETCQYGSVKQAKSDGKVCITFRISRGPRGASVCGAAWNMKAWVDR
jgi:hypothetical protein